MTDIKQEDDEDEEVLPEPEIEVIDATDGILEPFQADTGKKHKKKKNRNKIYGLQKERELMEILKKQGALSVVRSRGSFGTFDVMAFFRGCCWVISCKATRQKDFPWRAEMRRLEKVAVPIYCKKRLAIYWSPRADREKRGWELRYVS